MKEINKYIIQWQQGSPPQVCVDTEGKGHTEVCLTCIYLLTWPFSTCMHRVAKSLGGDNVLVCTSLTQNQTSDRSKYTNLLYGR